MPPSSSEAGAPIVTFGGGLGSAGKQGNPGLNPVATPGIIINTSKGSGG